MQHSTYLVCIYYIWSLYTFGRTHTSLTSLTLLGTRLFARRLLTHVTYLPGVHVPYLTKAHMPFFPDK